MNNNDQEFTSILQNVINGVIGLDQQALITYMNRTAERLIGQRLERVVGSSLDDLLKLIDLDTGEPFPKSLSQVLLAGEIDGFVRTAKLEAEEGALFEIDPNSHVVVDEKGKSRSAILMFYKADERELWDKSIFASELKFRDLLVNIQEGIWVIDRDANVVFVNPKMAQMMGYRPGEIIGKNIFSFMSEHGKLIENGSALEPGNVMSKHLYFEFTRKDGKVIVINVRTSPITDEDENYTGAIACVSDVTDQVNTENALHFQMRMKELLSDISSQFISCSHDEIDDAIDQALEKIARFTGADRSYIFLLSKDGAVVNNTHEWCVDGIEPQIELNQAIPVDEFPFIKKVIYEDKIFNVPDIYKLPIDAEKEKKEFEKGDIKSLIYVAMLSSGEIIGFIGFDSVKKAREWSDDIAALLRMVGEVFANALAHKWADEALRESERKYRNLIEQSKDAFYLLVEGKFEIIDRAFAEMFGVTKEEVRSPNFDFYDLVAPHSRGIIDERNRMQKQDLEKLSRYEFTAMAKDGRHIEVEASVSYVTYKGELATQGILRDISERKHLEAQLRQSQKMEAVGRLAGGIAHDFNNLLTVIQGNTALAMRSLDRNDPLRHDLEQIKNAAARASNLTHQLLAFSRQQSIELRVVEINGIVKEIEKMLRRLIGENIELVTRLAEELDRVKVDIGQIEQVIVNLAVNAADAMPDGGKLLVETQNIQLDSKYAKVEPEVQPGEYVVMIISDTGFGMSEEVRAQIFDPFYTTKKIGKGTGLGLSTVYGIVKQHKGHITVYSKPGVGSTFKVYLPSVVAKSESYEDESTLEELPFGDETVLVVEDEADVRSVAVRILQQQGYTVFEAVDGHQALEFIDSLKSPIDLLLTDVIMPGMSGPELVEKLTNKWETLKVLYMSGYTADIIEHHGILKPGIPYLRKPFLPTQLVLKVRQLLDEE